MSKDKPVEVELEDVKTASDLIAELKVSDKNFNRAKRIVEKKADIIKHDTFYDIDLIAILGMRHESVQKKKADAIDEAAKVIAASLDNGDLVLSDSFEDQHGIK
jgi:hypothetical protein